MFSFTFLILSAITSAMNTAESTASAIVFKKIISFHMYMDVRQKQKNFAAAPFVYLQNTWLPMVFIIGRERIHELVAVFGL